jgi:hypothetical protein
MPTLKNVSPLGAVDLPILGGDSVPAGAEFEVTDEQAELLLDQPDNFKLVTPKKKGA